MSWGTFWDWTGIIFPVLVYGFFVWRGFRREKKLRAELRTANMTVLRLEMEKSHAEAKLAIAEDAAARAGGRDPEAEVRRAQEARGLPATGSLEDVFLHYEDLRDRTEDSTREVIAGLLDMLEGTE